MKCLDFVLPGTFTNASALPLAYDDDLISNGTLMLWEPTHPTNPFSGVPTAPAAMSGSTISTPMPNIASFSAQALLGSVNVSPVFSRNDGAATAAPNPDMLIERSARGGLHVITSQATQSTGRIASLLLPNSIRDYIFANLGNTFYLSAWSRVTRVALANTGPYISLQGNGANAGVFNVGVSGNLGSISPSNSAISPSRNTLGNTIEQVANTWDGTPPASASDIPNLTLYGFGTTNISYGPSSARNKAFSAVLYRVFFEDLTVSGRSFAAVKAKDDAAYAAAFGTGGRYAGDTFTDPATLP
jgi:hypothetical protein